MAWTGKISGTEDPELIIQTPWNLIAKVMGVSSSSLILDFTKISDYYMYAMDVNPSGDIYGCAANQDIYKKTGEGSFTKLNQTVRQWQCLTASGSTVFCGTSNGGDIYKQVGGSGNFTATGVANGYRTSLSAAENGDIYTVDSWRIQKQTGGSGVFSLYPEQPESQCRIIYVTSRNDIYATGYSANKLYKQTGMSGEFVEVASVDPSSTDYNFRSLAEDSSGSIYAWQKNGDLYKQFNATGDFVAMNQGPKECFSMLIVGNKMYASFGGSMSPGVYVSNM